MKHIDLEEKNKVLTVLERFAQGVPLQSALRTYIPDTDDSEFADLIHKYKLFQEWNSANTVRKAVFKSIQELEAKTKAYNDKGIAVLGLTTFDAPTEVDNEALQQISIEYSRGVFFKVALAHEIYKHSFLPLDECIEKVEGLTPEAYYTHVATNNVLRNASDEVMSYRQSYLEQKMKADRLTLMNQVMESLKHQTAPGTKLTDITTATEKIYRKNKDNELKIVGEVVKTNKKEKDIIPSAHIMKTALELLGWTRSEEDNMPEAAMVLQNISPEELEAQRDKLQKEYEAMKEELNFRE